METVVIAHPDNPARVRRTTRAAFDNRYRDLGFVEIGDLKKDALAVAARAAGVTGDLGSTKAPVVEAIEEAVDHPAPNTSVPTD